MRPPLTVKVRVQWAGRQFIAARARHPDTGLDLWGEYKSMISDVPHRVTLPGQPDLWQPLAPDAWQLPLPEPVTLAEAGRMSTERTRFALVDEAEAADLAREMEADRATANAAPQVGASRRDEERQVWRDIWRITYEPVGRITAKSGDLAKSTGEGRILRALCYDQTIKVGHRKALKTSGSLLAEYGRTPEAPSAEELTHDWRPPFQPDPSDISDYENVIAGAINEYGWSTQEEEILRMRALDPPYSFALIGYQYDFSRQRARQIYCRAIKNICDAANGKIFRDAKGKLQKLRKANREAKAMKPGAWMLTPHLNSDPRLSGGK
jgi:hypothetical protein